MKNLIFVLSTVFFSLFSVNAFAQLEIMPDGTVELYNNLNVQLGLSVHKGLNVNDGQLFVDTKTNRVGIGTLMPGTSLDVIGSIKSTNIYTRKNNTGSLGSKRSKWNTLYTGKAFSVLSYQMVDIKHQENIRVIKNPIELIGQLNSYLFDYKTRVLMPKDLSVKQEETYSQQVAQDRVNHFGFNPKEVEEVLPQVVHYDEDTKLYSMSYSEIVPLLVEAVKAQQIQIEALRLEVEAMK